MDALVSKQIMTVKKFTAGFKSNNEKNLLTSVGIEPTTSGLDLPSLCRLSYKVAQRKSGTILDGESRRSESEGTYECCAA